jgi:hypothetical protein
MGNRLVSEVSINRDRAESGSSTESHHSRGSRRSLSSTGSTAIRAANELEHGPLGHDILPAVKSFIRDAFMSRFLKDLYMQEIDEMMKTEGSYVAWSSVAHCSQAGSGITSVMNVAMPDQSAEYWCTFIPAGQAPIFHASMPGWAIFSAITIYDTHGIPIASVNNRQVKHFQDKVKHGGALGDLESCNGALFRGLFPNQSVENSSSGEVFINLLKNRSCKGPLCAIFRVYRPERVHITPPEELPSVYFIEHKFTSMSDFSSVPILYVPLGKRELAFDSGIRFESKFSAFIDKKLKPLQSHQFGTQFFHPNYIPGKIRFPLQM